MTEPLEDPYAVQEQAMEAVPVTPEPDEEAEGDEEAEEPAAA